MGIKLTRAETEYTNYLKGLTLSELKAEMDAIKARAQLKQTNQEEESDRAKMAFAIKDGNTRRDVTFETATVKKEDADGSV